MDSVRTALAAVAAMLLARLLKLPEYYWAPISTIVIIQSTVPPLTLGWQRFVGTALGAVLGAALATFFSPNALVYGSGTFLCGVLAWWLRIGGAYRFAGITLSIIFPDQSRTSSVDRRLAPLSGSGAGNCGGSGSNRDMAPYKKCIGHRNKSTPTFVGVS
ncbi:MAG: FUSC family protein [Terriglobales bacterium]